MTRRHRISFVTSVALGLAGTSLVLEAGMLPGQMWFVQNSAPLPVPDQASMLVLQHGCWTGNPPLDMVGKIPGHVVIRFGDDDAKLGGERAVGIALEHIFQEPNPRVSEVYAFCR
jgi:hypothetical protein